MGILDTFHNGDRINFSRPVDDLIVGMGTWCMEQFQFDRSMEMLQETLPIHRLAESDNSVSVVVELNQIGVTLHQQRRFAEARAKDDEACGIQRCLYGDNIRTLTCRCTILGMSCQIREITTGRWTPGRNHSR